MTRNLSSIQLHKKKNEKFPPAIFFKTEKLHENGCFVQLRSCFNSQNCWKKFLHALHFACTYTGFLISAKLTNKQLQHFTFLLLFLKTLVESWWTNYFLLLQPLILVWSYYLGQSCKLFLCLVLNTNDKLK
jgi:hypothetical protein